MQTGLEDLHGFLFLGHDRSTIRPLNLCYQVDLEYTDSGTGVQQPHVYQALLPDCGKH